MAVLDVPIIEAKQENMEFGQLGSHFQIFFFDGQRGGGVPHLKILFI